MKDYITIEGEAQAEFVERKSRFIGYCRHVETETEALAFVEQLKKQNWDATHNVFAYSLREGQLKRCSDDGEPQGTAGVPVLDVLQKSGVVDVCMVVTRYFGGILLGAGGLVRAYSHGASIALEAAKKLHMTPCTRLSLDMDYGWYGKVSYILPQYNILVEESSFTDRVSMTLLIKSSRKEKFQADLVELTNGCVVPKEIIEEYADMQ
ncbi:MAG TPA: YigZ family protein [Candidatus Merdivicinus excrementipullorum]|uniref:YigZ family protein n=1 Tax=Candidatus Merdivicinus excrementipullorum TaxID=2840867 RepID=A0A9D1FMU8_9FIRM|nr:YigZ family protein [Candidatus Merdivicinus excrementipullorum]